MRAEGPTRRRARGAAVGAAVALVALAAPAQGAPGVSRYANPLIGTGGGGHTYPGAGVPFGFVAASPDTTQPSTSGYDPSGLLLGFSQTHVSGTGGNGMYGNFRLTPESGPLRARPDGSRFAQEVARPGFYSVLMTRDLIRASMSATRLAAIYRFRFTPGREQKVVLDATSAIEVPGGQSPKGSRVRIVGDRGIEGAATLKGGWNGARYTLYFALDFDRPFASAGTIFGDGALDNATVRGGANQQTGAWADFRPGESRTVQARIAVSFVSAARARANLASEIPNFDLDGVRARAARQWEHALGRVRVDGGTPAQRTAFYTALYHSQLMPHDLTGENRWWHSGAAHYEDYFALWDTFRTLHPLLTLLQPERQAAMVQSLVDTYRHTGWLPDARVAGSNGLTQVGSSGDVLVSDAMAKGLHGIDYRTAYKALLKDAEHISPDQLKQGRDLADYRRKGYLTLASGRSASRTLEYSYDDFAIAQVAKRLGHGRAVKKYLGRARNWRLLWDQSSLSVRPRQRDGSWLTPFDPDQADLDGSLSNFSAPFYEGSARQWSTFVPHDVRWLSGRLGGDRGFTAWLDRLFDSGQYNPGNEPDVLAPYLYLHAGRPDRTADRVRHVLATAYNASRDGLPGNDDAGALSSWYAWSAMGLYPNAGQPFYYIGSPIFRRVKLELGPGRTFEIDAPATSATNRYVRSATLGGRPLRRAWLDHREIARGGHLRLEMGPTPSDWATARRPPSL